MVRHVRNKREYNIDNNNNYYYCVHIRNAKTTCAYSANIVVVYTYTGQGGHHSPQKRRRSTAGSV